MLVGGMAEAVKFFSTTKALADPAKVQVRIVRSFRDDVPKYVAGDLQMANITGLFGRLPKYCGRQIVCTKIYDDDSKRNNLSLGVMMRALLVHFVHAGSPAGLPLSAGDDKRAFEIVFLDNGLAQRLLGTCPSDILTERDLVSAF